MINEFKVVGVEFGREITGRFSQIPRCDVHLSGEAISKMELADGDFIEIRGKRTTVGRVRSVDKSNFGIDIIGLNNLVRNNARVSLEDTVTVIKSDSKVAKKIVLAPIEKHLKKSELIKGLAKKSYQGIPFVEGDVTYLRSKLLRYLLGSVTWLRVVKTDPNGSVIVSEDTEFEIVQDPVNQTVNNPVYYLSEDSSDNDDFDENDLSLEDTEWVKLNSLLEVGLFNNLPDVMTFFLHEGINSRSDIFQKVKSVLDQIKQLKNDVSKP